MRGGDGLGAAPCGEGCDATAAMAATISQKKVADWSKRVMEMRFIIEPKSKEPSAQTM